MKYSVVILVFIDLVLKFQKSLPTRPGVQRLIPFKHWNVRLPSNGLHREVNPGDFLLTCLREHVIGVVTFFSVNHTTPDVYRIYIQSGSVRHRQH